MRNFCLDSQGPGGFHLIKKSSLAFSQCYLTSLVQDTFLSGLYQLYSFHGFELGTNELIMHFVIIISRGSVFPIYPRLLPTPTKNPLLYGCIIDFIKRSDAFGGWGEGRGCNETCLLKTCSLNLWHLITIWRIITASIFKVGMDVKQVKGLDTDNTILF